ncbi:hypothetical protein [Microbulbifer sp. ARAS458-1]|uniref:hypothetical protein n=1 Tax=Microbulbifer sp. ARAS458-1 TaxID=3140242 RepID=UPI00387819DE
MVIPDRKTLSTIVDAIQGEIQKKFPNVDIGSTRAAFATAHRFKGYTEFEEYLPYFPRANVNTRFWGSLSELIEGLDTNTPCPIDIERIQESCMTFPVFSGHRSAIFMDIDWDLGEISPPYTANLKERSEVLEFSVSGNKGYRTYQLPTSCMRYLST